jgi:spore coat protein CotH
MCEEFDKEYIKARFNNDSYLYKNGYGLANLTFIDNNPKTYKDLNFTYQIRDFKLTVFPYEKKTGKLNDYTELRDLIVEINKTNNFESFEKIFDVEKFLRQLPIEISLMNWDG